PLPELDFEAMSAEDLLRWGFEEFGSKLCLTCSWQKQSSVLVHMVSELELDIPVIELDTQLFFRETYETRDRLVGRYGLTLQQPQVITVAEQHKREGPNLWESDPDRCCHIRKVAPLLEALDPYDAWISGIRRDQSPSRATTPNLQSSVPSSRRTSTRSSTWTATSSAHISRRASASRRRTGTRTSSGSAGSPRA